MLSCTSGRHVYELFKASLGPMVIGTLVPAEEDLGLRPKWGPQPKDSGLESDSQDVDHVLTLVGYVQLTTTGIERDRLCPL